MRGFLAFSLVEVMVVVAIVGVLAALAVPSISALSQRRNATIATDSVVQHLERARDDARKERRCLHITRPTASQLQIDRLLLNADGSCSATVESTLLDEFNPGSISFAAGLDITFARTGGLTGIVGDSVDVSFNAFHEGRSDAHVVRIYKTLGLVRKIS